MSLVSELVVNVVVLVDVLVAVWLLAHGEVCATKSHWRNEVWFGVRSQCHASTNSWIHGWPSYNLCIQTTHLGVIDQPALQSPDYLWDQSAIASISPSMKHAPIADGHEDTIPGAFAMAVDLLDTKWMGKLFGIVYRSTFLVVTPGNDALMVMVTNEGGEWVRCSKDFRHVLQVWNRSPRKLLSPRYLRWHIWIPGPEKQPGYETSTQCCGIFDPTRTCFISLFLFQIRAQWNHLLWQRRK